MAVRAAAIPADRMTTDDFAAHVDLSTRQVQNLIAKGVLTSPARGFVTMPLARIEYIQSLRRAQEKATGGIGREVRKETADIRLERERLSLQRDQLTFHRDAGAVVAIEDASAHVAAVVEAVRAVLQVVPRKYGTDAADRQRLKLVCAAALSEAITESEKAVEALAPAPMLRDDEATDAA